MTLTTLLLWGFIHNALGAFGDLIIRHGYIVLFGFVAAESFSFPLPGEIAVLAGVFEASRGRLDLATVVAVVLLAAVVGDNAAYLAGRHAGRPALLRVGRLVHVHERRLESLEHRYDRNVWWAVSSARWLSPIRGWAALSAGAARVPWRRFFLANLLGGATWAVTASLAGYWLVRRFPAQRVEADFDLLTRIVGIALVVVVLVLVALWIRRRLSRTRHPGDATPSESENEEDPGTKEQRAA